MQLSLGFVLILTKGTGGFDGCTGGVNNVTQKVPMYFGTSGLYCKMQKNKK